MTALRRVPLLLTAAFLSVAAIGLTAGLQAANIHLTKRPVHPQSGLTVQALPRQTASWEQIGRDRIESAEIQEELGTENYVSRTYRQKTATDGPPKRVELHAAYYTGSVDTVPHVPDRCFVGGGMQIAGATVNVPLELDSSAWRLDDSAEVSELWQGQIYRVRISNDSRNAPGQYVRLPRRPHEIKLRCTPFTTPHGDRLVAGYFFIANGGHVPGADGVRLLAFDLKSDYAYYLKVQFTSFDVQSPEELAEVASDLLGELLGELMLCVPDWVDVTAGRWPEDNPRRQR